MMAKGIGLCGAHRTGKTTMTRQCARDYALALVTTDTSAVFAEHGLDPAAPMDFATRLWIQDKVLVAGEAVWGGQERPFITDRTPLDMLAYTLGDIRGDTKADPAQLADYTAHCFAATNRYFRQLLVIQPAIPLVAEPGKAALNEAYMEHLNHLVIGLCGAEEQQLPFAILPRPLLDLAERCAWLAEKCALPGQ